MIGDLDREIKKFLNSNDKLTVPPKVSKSIDETLLQIQSRGKRRLIRYSAIAAALFLTLTVGLAALFPAIAENLPLINRLIGDSTAPIDSLDNNYPDNDDLRGIIERYAMDVNKAVGDIELNKLAYDGVALYLSYEVSNTSSDELYSYDSSIIVNGISYSGQYYYPELIDASRIRVIQIYPILSPNALNIEEAEATIVFNKNHSPYSEIAVAVDLKKSLLLQEVNKIQLNKEIMLGSSKARLVSITESEHYFSLTVAYDSYNPEDEFILMDANGIELKQVDMGGIVEEEGKTLVTRLYQQSKNSKASKILVIEGRKKILSPASVKDKEFLDLRGPLPARLTIGNGKYITVLGITEDADTYRIIINAKDIAISAYIRAGGLALYDPDRMPNKNSSYYCGNAVPIDNDHHMLIYYKTNEFNYGNPELSFGNYDKLVNILYEIPLE